jgi:hypothetical protein
MKTIWLSAAVALIMVSPAAMAFQETRVEDAVAKERAEKQKQLQEINKVTNTRTKASPWSRSTRSIFKKT